MKHGINQRKLGRMPAHRLALLRNLVSALLHHETIKTTLPKAKEAAKLAEKIITLGKKGNNQAKSKAMAYLMPAHHGPSSSYTPSPTNPAPTLPPLSYPSSSAQPFDPETFTPPTSLLPKVFTTLSERYASRPGGYTRIHKFGRRQGDNAPHAIVCLVDGPRDLKFELLARTVGKESLEVLEEKGDLEGVSEGWEGLREKTRKEVERILRFRSKEEQAAFKAKAREYADYLQAEESAYGGLRAPVEDDSERPKYRPSQLIKPKRGRPLHAGERLSGMSIANTGLGLARGALGRQGRGRGEADRTPRFFNQFRDAEVVRGSVVERGSEQAL
ncbi:ribosomal protein L17 [Kwoniella shandongensis]|uniref:Ribosomal protein L17 n=1 Tax=Kwoniella shandongensis TaxID=1734106 RepID=A0A5M6C8H8_9TREE|nr:ribosomal protein L17 [Kwoniella shandongensis]KAA5531447.1 ribosomal protein L17 [Kwoniella shandongensis]